MAAHADRVMHQVPLTKLDLEVPAALAPVDAAAVVSEASRLGVRSVCVAPGLANAVRAAVPRRCLVATSCSQVAGWPGNSLLLHAAQQLGGRIVDELSIPVDAGLLGDAAWVARPLRQVVALCHAHGAFANVVIDVEGVGAGLLRNVVRSLARSGLDSVTLRACNGAVPAELATAAVDEAAPCLAVRASEAAATPERIVCLLDLGASSASVTPEQLASLLSAAHTGAEPAPAQEAAGKHGGAAETCAA